MAATLTVTNTSPLTAAANGTYYSVGLTNSGGIPDYTWDISVGVLPPGMSLIGGGWFAAQIAGTCVVEAVYTFTIRVTDSVASTATKAMSLTVGSALVFPTAVITGIPYEHYDELPRPWGDVVSSHEYDDGGRSFNRVSNTASREWQLDFRGGLSKTQTDVFDAFWDAAGTDRPFQFTDKSSVTWTGVRIKAYSRSHEAHRSWDRKVSFTLCKYPS